MPDYPVVTADTSTNTQSRYQKLREVLTAFYEVTGNSTVLEDNADDFPRLETRLWEAVGSLALFIDPSQPFISKAPEDGDTYRIVAYATRAGKIVNLRKARTASGTMTVAVKINRGSDFFFQNFVVFSHPVQANVVQLYVPALSLWPHGRCSLPRRSACSLCSSLWCLWRCLA